MQVPLEITCKGFDLTPKLRDVVEKYASRLDKVCDHVISCRLIAEHPHDRPEGGNEFRITLLIRMPPNHEVVVKRSTTEGREPEALPKVIRDVFQSAARQCREISRLQRNQVKRHPEQETAGIVVRLAPEDDYGFLRALDGRDVYFHRNSVLNGDFNRMTIGTGVRYMEEAGEEGPQATTVAIVDKPGVHRD